MPLFTQCNHTSDSRANFAQKKVWTSFISIYFIEVSPEPTFSPKCWTITILLIPKPKYLSNKLPRCTQISYKSYSWFCKWRILTNFHFINIIYKSLPIHFWHLYFPFSKFKLVFSQTHTIVTIIHQTKLSFLQESRKFQKLALHLTS